MPPQVEVRARHILVKTKEEAEAIIKKLEGGAKFEDLAKESSTDGTAANGGDLGYFSEGQMVPEFEKAALALKQGAGRLIRDSSDHGLLVIGDARLVEKPYGRRIWGGLSPFLRTRLLDEAQIFAERLKERIILLQNKK